MITGALVSMDGDNTQKPPYLTSRHRERLFSSRRIRSYNELYGIHQDSRAYLFMEELGSFMDWVIGTKEPWKVTGVEHSGYGPDAEIHIRAEVPMGSSVKCPVCGVKQIDIPWAREWSGFTLMMEAMILSLVRQMPVSTVAALMHETPPRIRRLVSRHAKELADSLDLSKVTKAGVDEQCRILEAVSFRESGGYCRGAHRAYTPMVRTRAH